MLRASPGHPGRQDRGGRRRPAGLLYEVDARTGELIGKLEAPESPNSHNLNLSADGKTAFMSPNNKVMTISDIKSRKVIKTILPHNVPSSC